MPTRSTDPDSLVQKALSANRESKRVEFKETFDVASGGGWCEIIKDVVAIANSGGGVIVFGVDSQGCPTGADLAALRTMDPAMIHDKIERYTDTPLADLQVTEAEKGGEKLVAWLIPSADVPLVFSKPGTYPVDGGKQRQRTAFGQGTVYFRHGAKSETGTTDDIGRALERKLDSVRKEWLTAVRKVVHAPRGSRVAILPAEVCHSTEPTARPVRLTADPSAPAYRMVDFDAMYPFRQKEVIAEVQKRVGKGVTFNSFDVLTVRHVYGIDEKPEFTHKPRFSSRQYSQAFIDWLVAEIEADPDFLSTARHKYREGV